MKLLDKIKLFWRADLAPHYAQHELLELTIKAGRRCAHDLEHAADFIVDKHYRGHYRARARMWLEIFYPAGGPKDYRHRMHMEIHALEVEVKRLEKFIDSHGLDHRDPDRIPF